MRLHSKISRSPPQFHRNFHTRYSSEVYIVDGMALVYNIQWLNEGLTNNIFMRCIDNAALFSMAACKVQLKTMITGEVSDQHVQTSSSGGIHSSPCVLRDFSIK